MRHVHRFAALFPMVALAACEARPSTAAPTAPSATPASAAVTASPSGLTKIARASEVCMVNDQFMGKDQIPVMFEGKTYYGCCEGCKAKLQTLASARTAIDPVSGHPVDKATAVLARDPNGKVLYFESDESLQHFAH